MTLKTAESPLSAPSAFVMKIDLPTVAPAACACLALAILTTGCGGGGGDDAAAPPPATTAVTVSGVAAVGAMLSNASVTVKCSGGNATGITATDGSYSVPVSGGALPCAVRVSGSGVTLHSLATGTGSSATANVTTLTEMVLASAQSLAPAAWFDAFTAASAPATGALTNAVAAVETALQAAGVDTTALADPFTAPLAAGNAQDALLDAVGAAPLPAAELLTAAADVTCSGLRSGTYRILVPGGGEDGVASDLLRVDTQTHTLTVYDSGKWNKVISYTASGGCRFGTPDGATFVVAATGIIVGKVDGGVTPFIAFPEQTAALADLAGTWNGISVDTSEGVVARQEVTLDASGGITGTVRSCDLVNANCTDDGGKATITVDPAGGYRATFADGTFDRLYLYRGAGGARMLVGVWHGDVGFEVLTPKAPRALPAVGAVRNSFELQYDLSLSTASPITDFQQTVVSVDSGAGTWVRRRTLGASTVDETLAINVPVDGYTHRAAQSLTAANGQPANVREFTALGVPALDLAFIVFPANGTSGTMLGLSLTKR